MVSLTLHELRCLLGPISEVYLLSSALTFYHCYDDDDDPFTVPPHCYQPLHLGSALSQMVSLSVTDVAFSFLPVTLFHR